MSDVKGLVTPNHGNYRMQLPTRAKWSPSVESTVSTDQH